MISRELLRLAGGLLDPDMEMAFEFVFRDYAKLYSKWMQVSFKGVSQPELRPVIKKVAKRFNSYNKPSSQFSWKELEDGYVAYREKECGSKSKGKEQCFAYYGINTL